jgi:chromosome segregation ATPase
VTTIIYLMSLQDQVQVPFRIVDEINQGMDPRNERLVHRQFVGVTSAENTPQYFLITPKLLPDLTYSDTMRVLFVCNSDHQPDRLALNRVLAHRRQLKGIVAR